MSGSLATRSASKPGGGWNLAFSPSGVSASAGATGFGSATASDGRARTRMASRRERIAVTPVGAGDESDSRIVARSARSGNRLERPFPDRLLMSKHLFLECQTVPFGANAPRRVNDDSEKLQSDSHIQASVGLALLQFAETPGVRCGSRTDPWVERQHVSNLIILYKRILARVDGKLPIPARLQNRPATARCTFSQTCPANVSRLHFACSSTSIEMRTKIEAHHCAGVAESESGCAPKIDALTNPDPSNSSRASRS